MISAGRNLVLECCAVARPQWHHSVPLGRSRVSYLKSALCQKLFSTPACLLSYGLTLPLLWLISVTVSDRAACALLSMSGSDKWALTRCPSKAAAALHNSRRDSMVSSWRCCESQAGPDPMIVDACITLISSIRWSRYTGQAPTGRPCRRTPAGKGDSTAVNVLSNDHSLIQVADDSNAISSDRKTIPVFSSSGVAAGQPRTWATEGMKGAPSILGLAAGSCCAMRLQSKPEGTLEDGAGCKGLARQLPKFPCQGPWR